MIKPCFTKISLAQACRWIGVGRGGRLWPQFKQEMMATQTREVPVEMEKMNDLIDLLKEELCHDDIILGQTGKGQFKEKEELKMTQGLEILPWKIGMAVSGSEMGKLECTIWGGKINWV